MDFLGKINYSQKAKGILSLIGAFCYNFVKYIFKFIQISRCVVHYMHGPIYMYILLHI